MRHLADWQAALRYSAAAYATAHGRPPRLVRPRRFTEKILWRKLFDLDPRYTILSDKLAVRDFIAARVGPDLLIPLLWHGADPGQLPFTALAPPYVIKSSHGSGHVLMVGPDGTIDGAPLDPAAVRATLRGWLAHCHGTANNEPGYIAVPRRILVERTFQAPGGGRPLERRLFVFGGRVRAIATTVVEDGRLRHGAFHDAAWTPLPWHFTRATKPESFARPAGLDGMIRVAEALGAGFDHLRVDFYDTGDQVRLGELTLYSWSGQAPFTPDEADTILGSWWPLPLPWLRAPLIMLMRRRPVPLPPS